MLKDRAALTVKAASLAEAGVDRFRDNRYMYDCYLQCGVINYKYTKDTEMFYEALDEAQEAYDRILDPDLLRTIRKYEATASNFV